MTWANERTKGALALIGTAFAFAALNCSAKFLGNDLGIFQQIYLRSSPALLISLVFGARSFGPRREKGVNQREWCVALLRALVWYLLAVAPFIVALRLAPVASASILSAIPLTPLFTWLLFKERLKLEQVLLVILSFAGVTLISSRELFDIESWGRGEVIAALTAGAFSLGIASRRYHAAGLSEMAITEMFLIFSVIIPLLVSLALGEPQTIPASLGVYLNLILGGVLVWLALYLCNYGIARVSGALAGNLFLFEFFFGAILGYLLFGEMLSLRAVAGALVIIFCALRLNSIEAAAQVKLG